MSQNAALPPFVVIAEGPCPLMGRSDGFDPDGSPRSVWGGFEKPLSWRLSAESALVLRHKGIKVKQVCAFHDVSRHFLDCVLSAPDDIKGFAQSYLISPGEAFTLDLDISYDLLPFAKKSDAEDWEVVGAGRYWHDADPVFMETINGMDEVNPEVAYSLYQSHHLDQKVIEPRIAVSRQTVWSSGNATSLENFASLEDWVERECERIGRIAASPADHLSKVMDTLLDVSIP